MRDPTEAILTYLRQVGAGLDPDFLREAARVMSALLMELEVKQQIGADRYEHTEERTTYRNGYRDWDWQIGCPLPQGAAKPPHCQPGRGDRHWRQRDW